MKGTQIILVGSKVGNCGYHVIKDGRLVFRMSLTLDQRSNIKTGVLCGINPRKVPDVITIINPFSIDSPYTEAYTLEEAKTCLCEAFQEQFKMFMHDFEG